MGLRVRLYEFGDFSLDPTEQVLLCAGKPVQLTPRAFAVLRVLVDNAGHVVEKQDLMQAVWVDAVVEEANLPQTICILRKVLGERHRGHHSNDYIQTVARRGYRFVAAVKILDEPANLPPGSLKPTPELNGEGKHAYEALKTSNPEKNEAYHLYLRGRHYWSKYTIEDLTKGIQQFTRALEIDSDCSLAYTGLGDCYYRLANIHLPPRKAMPKAKRAVLTALELDDRLSEAHALLGLIRMFFENDLPAAENEFKRAIELAPASALAHKRYGWALAMQGRFDEAITEINRALRFEPRWYEAYVGLGIVLHMARRYDSAVVQAHLALDMEPEFFPAHILLGIAHVQQGRFSEAIAELETAAGLADLPFTLGYLGYACGVSENRRQASMVLTELESRSARAYVTPYAMALVHIGLGDKERALQSLVETAKDRNEMRGFIRTSPEFDNLRSDERFIALQL